MKNIYEPGLAGIRIFLGISMPPVVYILICFVSSNFEHTTSIIVQGEIKSTPLL